MPQFERITFDPNVMGGRACIRGMRITVSLVLNLVANGMTVAEIIEAYRSEKFTQIGTYLVFSSCFTELPTQLLHRLHFPPNWR